MARQVARLANGNIPYHGHHARFMNGCYPGAGGKECFFLSFFLISIISNPFLSRSLNFSGSLNILGSSVFFWEFCKNSQNPQVPGSAVAVQGLTVSRSLGGEKIMLCTACFAYSLLALL